MVNSGYIKMHRSLMDKGYYLKSEYVHLWLHLIYKATYTKREFMFNDKIEVLQPGQFITSRNKLSIETGIEESKIERILNVFKTEQQIEQQSRNKFRIISILNWNEYQNLEQQNELEMNSKRTASEQQVNTNNKDKKEKKERINREFIVPSIEEIRNYCIERKNSINPNYFFDYQVARDWKLKGGQKIKDWQAVIRTWERNSFNTTVTKPVYPEKSVEELIS